MAGPKELNNNMGQMAQLWGISSENYEKLQQEFLQRWNELQTNAQGALAAVQKDRRFKSEAWSRSPMHLQLAHYYLLYSDMLLKMADQADVPEKTRQRVRFAVNQLIDASSPANFFASNPDAIEEFLNTKGESLQKGIENLAQDIRKQRVTQTDETAFVIGENIALTPGSVVFENKYFQLIQYAPQTAQVYQRPLLLVPPCINKYYILDLQPENSLVAYAVSQGHTVFLVSWRNPLAEDTDGILQATWDEYIGDGVLKAIDVACDISAQEKINALGFCVGGTMLSTAVAVDRAKGNDRIESLTLLTTLLDFKETGILDVFVDEGHAAIREQQIGEGGLMTAQELSTTFSFLRPNDLVWNYVVNNYLKGKAPAAFDLLYWNADGTNLPGPFFTWYFRNTYLENNVKELNKLTVCGEPLSLQNLDMPAYLYGSREDHIVPWEAAYASTQLLTGDVRFVLGASGHIAGVINPASKNKRNYWTFDGDVLPETQKQWFAHATEQPGSWWSDWALWLEQFGGRKVKAKLKQGNLRHKVLESAPGRYVKVRAV